MREAETVYMPKAGRLIIDNVSINLGRGYSECNDIQQRDANIGTAMLAGTTISYLYIRVAGEAVAQHRRRDGSNYGRSSAFSALGNQYFL